jgi:hypothetical protein
MAALLVEIDEIWSAPIVASRRALHIGRRKKLYEQLHPRRTVPSVEGEEFSDETLSSTDRRDHRQGTGNGCAMQAEYALTRRAVTLIVELERREVMFAQAGEVADEALAIYQTTVNTLRHTLGLGLQRRSKASVRRWDLLRADLEQQRQEQQRRSSCHELA